MYELRKIPKNDIFLRRASEDADALADFHFNLWSTSWHDIARVKELIG
jgi:hypothetical protein